MDLITHLVVGALIYIFTFQYFAPGILFYAVFFAILPDLDLFLAPLRRKLKSKYLEHRSGSHSYIMGILISAIIGSIYSFFTTQSFFIVWIVGIIFYGVHISLDLLNTTRIPCFYPISKKEYSFYVEKAGSSFTLLTSLIFIISYMLAIRFSQNASLAMFILYFYAYFTLVYYSYRILAKIWISSHLNENQKYFPGVLPTTYYIYESETTNNVLSLTLTKKSHVASEKVLYENRVVLTPVQEVLLKKSIEICKEDYYHAKWTVLPIVSQNDGIISIRLFFIEPLFRSRAMYVQFDFNIFSEELMASEQSFGRLNSM
jgi:membrane-bound metal-dependent hydrolase YbcI (DUF457 family)